MILTINDCDDAEIRNDPKLRVIRIHAETREDGAILERLRHQLILGQTQPIPCSGGVCNKGTLILTVKDINAPEWTADAIASTKAK